MTAFTRALRPSLFAASSLLALCTAHHATFRDTLPPPARQADDGATTEVVVKVNKTMRSSVELGGSALQRILPGCQSAARHPDLPGVLFETADPRGNNEQNETQFVHGFGLQQLSYTFDNLPLGDQQYGNWNGLSVSRAVTSENVSRVHFASGAAGLGVASSSNLGGAIETFSSDPSKTFGVTLAETLGTYNTYPIPPRMYFVNVTTKF